VTAGSDPTGVFRLHLDVHNDEHSVRRIVLEGRTGFATVSGGVHRQTVMIVSPTGEFVISGQPGGVVLTETATLQSRGIMAPRGWVISEAAFSPDGAHLALTMLNPQTKQSQFTILATKSLEPRSPPAETQFIRWLGKDTVLLKGHAGLIEYDTRMRTSLPLFQPEGWNLNNVIPETGIQLLTGNGGKFGLRNGGPEIHEILAGTGVVSDRSVADDLSQFGGLDVQKRLWVQQGLGNSPEIIAENVNKVLWGPISRRALVAGADGSFRVYDGRDRSWTTLPSLTAAQWSPDESRLLYTETEHQNSAVPRYLSLLTGRQTERLCDINRIGDIAGVALSNNGDTAFLLAGADAGMQVFMLALPPRTPQPR
jgi:hypothetical protein